MSARRSVRPSVLLGLALGGVLLGHTIAYRLLLPDAHARAHELARSGHGYLGGADAIAVVAAVAALSALFLGRLLRAEDATVASIATRLAGFQLAAFAAMEILERLSSGAGSAHLGAVLAVGLPVQALVAVAIALAAKLLLRAAEVAAAHLTRAAPPAPAVLVPSAPAIDVPAARWAPGTPPGRAPPFVVVPA